jgi:hypothetical protein
MILKVIFLQNSFKLLILLLYFFKTMALFACFVDFYMLYYMYMNKNDIKSLLVAAAIVAFGYALMYGYYYFADYIGIYESLRY